MAVPVAARRARLGAALRAVLRVVAGCGGEPAETKGGDGHSHGEAKSLGERKRGGFSVAATQEGAVAAGTETGFRVKIAAGSGKVTVVRLWIGAADGKGALKAKAELEGDAWHAHAEAPASLDGAGFHVQFETDGGAEVTASFDLAK